MPAPDFCLCESCSPTYLPTRLTIAAARVDALLREMGVLLEDDDGATLRINPERPGLEIYVSPK